jgi:hypothetical protein
MSPDSKPDWSKWRLIPDYHLCEAVALSLDTEPRDVRDTSRYPYHSAATNASTEFVRRATILERIVQSEQSEQHGLMLQRTYAAPLACTITPADFVRWAQANDWTMPSELVELAAAQSTRAQPLGARWPWGEYETALLSILVDTAKHWWLTYDPAEPGTAPTDKEVVSWLQSKHGLTQNKAEAIAAILRADDLPKGPRR